MISIRSLKLSLNTAEADKLQVRVIKAENFVTNTHTQKELFFLNSTLPPPFQTQCELNINEIYDEME